MTKTRKLAAGGFAALFVAATGCSSAMAFDRMLDPNVLPPQEREFALHGPLGDVGPRGEPTPTGCQWSRLQVPTSEGLRWIAIEQCDDDSFGR